MLAAGAAATGGGALLMDDEEEMSEADQAFAQAAQEKGITPDQARTEFSNTIRQELKASAPDDAEGSNFLEQFESEFDLATLGMALLASNTGENRFSVNLGKALGAARSEAQRKKSGASKEDRAERSLKADEKRAEASMVSALARQTSADAAQAKGQGLKTPRITKTLSDEAGNLLSTVFDIKVPDNTTGKTLSATVARALDLQRQAMQRAGRPMSPQEDAQFVKQYVDTNLSGVIDKSVFGSDVDKDRLQQGLAGQGEDPLAAAQRRIAELRAKQ